MPSVFEYLVANKGYWAFTCCAFYIAYYILYMVYSLLVHPLSKFPGPRLWAVSRIPWAWHTIKGDIWSVLDKLHEKYGSVVRIAPDELTTINPIAWKDIYVAKPVLAKDPYSLTPPLNGAHSLFTAEGEVHKRLRNALIHGFSDKASRDQAPIVEHYADQFVSRLHREITNGRDGRVDIQKMYGYATFDTITDLSFGDSLQSTLKSDSEHDEIKSFFLHAKFSTIRNCLSRFSPLDVILGLFLLGVTRKRRERNWRLVTSKLDERLSKGNLGEVRSDLLTPLVGKLDKDEQKGTITEKELTTNHLAFVIADCQLTTVALSTATFLLLQNPKKLQRLTYEIRSQFQKNELITVQSTQGLPYLEAVIKETMRFRHPTPISLPRYIPSSGRKIDGHFIPGNTIIGINLQNIQNSPTLWIEPHAFHPERFLPESDPQYEQRFNQDNKTAYMPFSTGPRNCVGAKVFLAQARLFLAKFIWNFDMDMEAGQDNWLDQKAYLVFEPKELIVNLQARANSGIMGSPI